MIIRPLRSYYRYYARRHGYRWDHQPSTTDYSATALADARLAGGEGAYQRRRRRPPPDRNLSNPRTTFGVTFVQVPRARTHTCSIYYNMCNNIASAVVRDANRTRPDGLDGFCVSGYAKFMGLPSRTLKTSSAVMHATLTRVVPG
jgi:hypothetical protein